MQEIDFEQQRRSLIETELRNRGINDQNVLRAMHEVPREEFVSDEVRELAYRNAPLPIGSGQTISQPLIVALMAEAMELNPDERILEIGTGSGYAAAVLSRLVKEVYSVERIRSLAKSAAVRLHRLGYDNIRVARGDGTRGWPKHAPYDAIGVAAGGPKIPPALLKQLRIGGRLVIPVGDQTHRQQMLRIVRKSEDDFETTDLGQVSFVPLIGETGWQTEGHR